MDMDFRCSRTGAPGMMDCRLYSIPGEGVRGGRSNTAVNTAPFPVLLLEASSLDSSMMNSFSI